MSDVAPPLLAHGVLAKVLVVRTEGDDTVPGSSDGLFLLVRLGAPGSELLPQEPAPYPG